MVQAKLQKEMSDELKIFFRYLMIGTLFQALLLLLLSVILKIIPDSVGSGAFFLIVSLELATIIFVPITCALCGAVTFFIGHDKTNNSLIKISGLFVSIGILWGFGHAFLLVGFLNFWDMVIDIVRKTGTILTA